jgi:glucosamine--fructose-6-phosphate aminotransferase (isomerizing)
MSAHIIQNIQDQIESLRRVAEHHLGAGRELLLDCADLLRKSGQIVVSGMGASLFSSLPLSYWIAEHGIILPVIETSELFHFLSPGLMSATTMVLVSRSGESVEVTKLLPILRERGITVIGVTNVAGSTLARRADRAILVSCPADQLVAIQTYTATMLVCGMIAAAMGDRLDKTEEDIELLLRVLPSYLDSCLRDPVVHRSDATPTYFLGRGPALASVQESALLLHEVAKTPAVGMSAAQFRHGPVEVLSHDFRAVIFGTQTKTRDLDYALAVDLHRAGAEVRWIGPQSKDSPIRCLGIWPEEIPDWCATLLEIVPIQVLACRTAEARGIRVGEFRFASPVTLSESGFPGSSNTEEASRSEHESTKDS